MNQELRVRFTSLLDNRQTITSPLGEHRML
jgi:hypothetical protein